MNSNQPGNKGQAKVSKYSHEDVIAEGAGKDVEFQRAISTIEALQSSKGSYIIAKGALDKADAAFLIEEDEKRKHSERVMEERERRAFLEAQKLAMEEEEAENKDLRSGMNQASKSWSRVGVQGERNKAKKKTVTMVHHLVKKRRLKEEVDDELDREEEEDEEENTELEKQGGGNTGEEAVAYDEEKKGTELQSLLDGYGSSSSEENDDDDQHGTKLPSARELI